MQLINSTSSIKTINVPSSLTLIKNYLGVYLDSEFKYLNTHVKEDVCYISAEKKSGDAQKDADQTAIFKTVIKCLKHSAPLCTLGQLDAFSKISNGLRFSTRAFEKSKEEEFVFDDIVCVYLVSTDIKDKANLITAIFNDRIKSLCLGNVTEERYHRTVLAAALEWHLESYINEDVKEEKPEVVVSKESNSSSEKIEIKSRRYSSPNSNIVHSEKPSKKMIGSSPELGDKNIRKTSGNRLHLTLHELTSSSSSSPSSPKRNEKISPRRLSPKETSEQEALIQLISPAALYNCRNHWIQMSKKKEIESDIPWPEADYLLAERIGILKNPMMHLLIQEELARNIIADLSEHGLMQDIHRNLSYIAKCNIGLIQKNIKIIDLKKHNIKIENKDLLDFENYDTEVSHFYSLIRSLVKGLGLISSDQESIINLWELSAIKELKDGLSDESFIFAGICFLRKLARGDPSCNKLFQLLALLRQKMYMHPMQVVREVIQMPLEYQFEDPKRLMQFIFFNGSLEFHTSIKAIPSKVAEKWPQRQIKCTTCDIEILNIMRPDNKQLSSWSSNFEIKLNIFRYLKEKKSAQIPNDIKLFIIEPLTKLGFKINVNFVGSKIADSL